MNWDEKSFRQISLIPKPAVCPSENSFPLILLDEAFRFDERLNGLTFLTFIIQALDEKDVMNFGMCWDFKGMEETDYSMFWMSEV